ncbi:GntR family transcriptional regulator [Pseudonocardia acaciae]|uniref:GntR family transcriptional regulator n=1 Tax=Pseudonocardia acaciae TaxID=551276 RepID=UPI0012EE1D30
MPSLPPRSATCGEFGSARRSRTVTPARALSASSRVSSALLHEEGLIGPIAGRGWVVVERSSASGVVGLLPRYRQIAAELRAAIEEGRLWAGAALPREAGLIARYAVSRATVRQALAVLEPDGLITTHPGEGRYVRVR